MAKLCIDVIIGILWRLPGRKIAAHFSPLPQIYEQF
jgi:hypothetical protein